MTKIKVTNKSKFETTFNALSYYTFFKSANDSILMKIPPVNASDGKWNNAILFDGGSCCSLVWISENSIVIPYNEVEIVVSM